MSRFRIFGLAIGIVLIVAVLALVLLQELGGSLSPTALAQAQATATSTPLPPTGTPTPGASAQAQQIGDTFWTILAGKLGVNADDLKAKAVEARREMIDQAVKDGRITQAQADEIKKGITSNNIINPIRLPASPSASPLQPPRVPLPYFGPGWFTFPGMFWGGLGVDSMEAVAKSLNMTSAQLIQELASGKTLADIAAAQGVDEAVVKQAIIDSAKAQIDRLLAAGLITQQLADAYKAELTPENIDLKSLGIWGLHRGWFRR